MTIEEIRGAVARGWCHPKNAHKVMDPDLALAISDEVYKAEAEGGAMLGLATTAELLEELRARAEVGGYDTYRTYDGGKNKTNPHGHSLMTRAAKAFLEDPGRLLPQSYDFMREEMSKIDLSSGRKIDSPPSPLDSIDEHTALLEQHRTRISERLKRPFLSVGLELGSGADSEDKITSLLKGLCQEIEEAFARGASQVILTNEGNPIGLIRSDGSSRPFAPLMGMDPAAQGKDFTPEYRTLIRMKRWEEVNSCYSSRVASPCYGETSAPTLVPDQTSKPADALLPQDQPQPEAAAAASEICNHPEDRRELIDAGPPPRKICGRCKKELIG
jgi:hypothetical protein